MVFKNILGMLSEFLVQHVAGIKYFRDFARFVNINFSPKKDIGIKVRGHIMYANTLDRIVALYLWKFSALEGFETELTKKITRKGMTVFDIGANIGYYTLMLAKLVGNNGKVYAFEPDPENYRLLVKNIKSNGYKNVIAVQKAVSNKNKKIKFFLSEEHRGNHRIYDPGDIRRVIEVEATTLDKFTCGKVKPDIVKIDIEGAELLAISGMQDIIKWNKKIIIICEVWPSAMEKCGYSLREFISKLEVYGFKINLINENKKRVEPTNYTSLIMICSGNKYANLLLKR